jgi:hypothetical protein
MSGRGARRPKYDTVGVRGGGDTSMIPEVGGGEGGKTHV